MDLEEGDYLIGLEIVGEEGLILSISENGFGKRTLLRNTRKTVAIAFITPPKGPASSFLD